MKLKNVLIVVNNMEHAKTFYKELLGLDVILDSEGNAVLTEGLVLQDASVWKESIEKEAILPNHAAELYFEEADIDRFVERLEGYREPVRYVSRLEELPWGQKMVRFYDPDGHMIEVRTPLEKQEGLL